MEWDYRALINYIYRFGLPVHLIFTTQHVTWPTLIYSTHTFTYTHTLTGVGRTATLPLLGSKITIPAHLRIYCHKSRSTKGTWNARRQDLPRQRWAPPLFIAGVSCVALPPSPPPLRRGSWPCCGWWSRPGWPECWCFWCWTGVLPRTLHRWCRRWWTPPHAVVCGMKGWHKQGEQPFTLHNSLSKVLVTWHHTLHSFHTISFV